MKYTVEDKNGTPHGPITEEEVLELVQQDLLLSDSKMKKAMMPTWDKAGSFDFLKDAFAEQQADTGACDDCDYIYNDSEHNSLRGF